MSLRSRSEAWHVIGNIGAGGTNVIVAAAAGQLVRVYRLIVVNGAAGQTLTLQDTSGTAISQGFVLLPNATITLDTPINNDPWFFSGDRGAAAPVIGLGIQWVGTAAFGYDLWYLQSAL